MSGGRRRVGWGGGVLGLGMRPPQERGARYGIPEARAGTGAEMGVACEDGQWEVQDRVAVGGGVEGRGSGRSVWRGPSRKRNLEAQEGTGGESYRWGLCEWRRGGGGQGAGGKGVGGLRWVMCAWRRGGRQPFPTNLGNLEGRSTTWQLYAQYSTVSNAWLPFPHTTTPSPET